MRYAVVVAFRHGLLLVIALARTASASPEEAAAAFERGRVFEEQGRLPEACAAFAESVRLDFQFGALFNFATCEQKRGNLATALGAFRQIAEGDTNKVRAARSREYVSVIEPRVSRIRVAIAGATSSTAITLDSKPVRANAPIAVDPGVHRIVVTTPTTPPLFRTVEITKENELVTIDIAQTPVTLEETSGEPNTPPGDRTAKIVIAGGAVTLVAGLVVGGVAFSRWRSAQDLAESDPDAANERVDGVMVLGNTSTVLLAAGAIAIGVGIYLWRR